MVPGNQRSCRAVIAGEEQWLHSLRALISLVNKGNMGNELMPVISSWAMDGMGLDALTNPWNLVLGFAVFVLGTYIGQLVFYQ